jgi:hypothetical protein
MPPEKNLHCFSVERVSAAGDSGEGSWKDVAMANIIREKS